jgi:hypothetical protein
VAAQLRHPAAVPTRDRVQLSQESAGPREKSFPEKGPFSQKWPEKGLKTSQKWSND